MKFRNILLASASMVLVASVAQASHIGPAGCGLGNVLFKKESQILASTTNGSTYTNYFGITSGTSNCVEGGHTAMMLQFIDVNKVALSKEAARGEGETISSLAKLAGCNDAQTLGISMKTQYETLFPTEDVGAAHVTRELQQLMRSNAELAAQCTPVS